MKEIFVLTALMLSGQEMNYVHLTHEKCLEDMVAYFQKHTIQVRTLTCAPRTVPTEGFFKLGTEWYTLKDYEQQ